LQIPDYCRQIEAYLCQKNDGHLIRVVGPSFDLVSGWAAGGVPLKVALRGIDRYFERYYRKGPRRRPVKIDFCEADVLDVFDEWRRAIGLTAGIESPSEDAGAEHVGSAGSGLHAKVSLPEHLERVIVRLTNARATGTLGADADALIDRISGELDAARAAPGGIRGAARRALLVRLEALDRELAALALAAVASERAVIDREAEAELADFRTRMAPDRFARARDSIVDRLVRERLRLPTLSF
jgi:hypothetical protein